ncbi:L-asparagine oxygenase [Gemmata sp. SH-PL17]|uniref:TauD/TfdA family dioxygenase n=1 Tax=Gemmata sp. SH-PL17 TaxID=1630693 RepID=UPI00078C31CE|nr:TauD/TfdA family dioxygenase [Gemmata sp. SH-PL17]AMV24087.1 L-asparagine oxygenase [Gemmata sp. SH-PL17]
MTKTFRSLALPPAEVTRWQENVRKFGYPSGATDLYALAPREALTEVRGAPRPINDEFVLGSIVAQATAPPAVTEFFARFGRPGGPDAAVLDLGPGAVDIDPGRHMPVRGRRNPAKPFGFDEIALLGIVQGAGFPMALVPEAGLDLVMPVSPVPGHEASRSSKGAAQLGWHVDNLPFAPDYRPDFLALMGLVSTEPVVTSFALIDDVLAALQEYGGRYKQVLRQPLFRYATPASFHLDGSEPVLSHPMPVIAEGPDGRPVFNFNEYTLSAGDDPEVTAALGALGRVLRDGTVVRGECVAPGKVLVLSNTRVLHARGEVRGTRYLARMYGKRDLSALRALPSGGDRVCRYRFPMTPAEMVAACRAPEPAPM